MTYGATTAELRRVITELLRRHRILQPLGGPGICTVPETTTVEERREMGAQIQRFRYATLLWCHHAVVAVTPKFTLRDTDCLGRTPPEDLRYRLGKTIGSVTVGLPGSGELATAHPNILVETWRQAALAAAIGEHDFPAGVHYSRLDASESRAVLKDGADFVRGLIILDRRYRSVPGWEFLKGPGWLGQAADECSTFAAAGERDYAVDQRGWRPPPASIQGPALPGIAGVLQAQHNMLVDLVEVPTALNLRRIFRSQCHVAHEAARHAAAAAPELVERFLDRDETYKSLQRAGRNLGGLVGNGGVAAAESHHAEARLKRLPVSDLEDATALHELAKLSTRVDARIASTIECGFAEKVYLVSVKYPRLGDPDIAGIVQPRERWVPVTSPVQTDLLPIVRRRLRPYPPKQTVARESTESRSSYQMRLAEQPGVQHRSHSGPTR